MDPATRSRLEARARVLKALAHPTRLLVVDALTEGERSVGELRDLVGDDLSTVSRHLAVLRDAGLIVAEKRGNQVFHALTVPCVTDFFGCVKSVLQHQASLITDLAAPR